MGKHSGGEGSLVITLDPVAPDTEGVPINMCITSIDSLELPKGWQPSHTTCDYDPVRGVTFTRRKRLTSTLRWSVTCFSEDQLDEDQEQAVFDSDTCGPVILKRHGSKGFYMPLATIDVSFRPGGTDAIQSFTINGESEGEWAWGVVAPGP